MPGRKGSAIIQKSIGAQGTRLHRKNGDLGVPVAIAEWESKELRDAAMKKLDQEPAEIQTILNRHKDFGEIEILATLKKSKS